MLGLFGSLNLGARSLQTQQQGMEVAGHNLANVNNPAYARQRLAVQTSTTFDAKLGPEGTGVDAVAIVRLRDLLVDHQITSETSVTGSLEAQQEALQNGQAALGQVLDTQGSASSGQHGIAEGLNDLFNEFETLSTDPSSLSERQVLLSKAADLAAKFTTIDQRLTDLKSALNDSLDSDLSKVNLLLKDIAKLNDTIASAETSTNGVANDLRDTRQAKLEELAKLVKIDTSNGVGGAVNISIGGASVVDGKNVANTLESYDAGGGQILVRTVTGGTGLTMTGGRLQGTIDARDGALTNLQSSLNTLASTLITQVNTIHAAGFGLGGSTNAKFFNGTDASDIAVNSALENDPGLIQASGVSGAAGDNKTILALAQLANKPITALSNLTLNQNYNKIVSTIGQALSSANSQVDDQKVVTDMLQTRRDSTSGVSLDEEMTDMVKYQKAFQASAKIITTVDEMLDIVINMKR